MHRIVSRIAKLLPRSIQLGVYKVPLISGVVRWVLTRGTRDEPVLVRVVSGPLAGRPIYVNLRCQKYYWLGTYEAEVQSVIVREVGQGHIVYDIGAHIGFFSLLFSIMVGSQGEVHCFEPLPENVEILRRQLGINQFERVVTVVSSAVTSETGSVSFYVNASSSMGTVILDPQKQARRIRVNAIRLDDYIDRGSPPPHLIKMDIEGGETEAVLGMSQTLKTKRPRIIIEFHSDQAKSEVWKILRPLGYSCFSLRAPFERCLSPRDAPDCHFLFKMQER